MEKRTPAGVLLCGTLGLIVSGAASAATLDEAVDGDFSTDGANPTAITLDLGANIIAGTSTSDPQDRDFITFTIGAGQSLDSLVLNTLDTTLFNSAFLGIIDAASFPTPIDSVTPFDLLGFILFDQTWVGADLLEGVNDTNDNPINQLGPGTYSIWYQETTAETAYSFTANLVPEPGSAALLLIAAGGLLRRRRR